MSPNSVSDVHFCSLSVAAKGAHTATDSGGHDPDEEGVHQNRGMGLPIAKQVRGTPMRVQRAQRAHGFSIYGCLVTSDVGTAVLASQ